MSPRRTRPPASTPPSARASAGEEGRLDDALRRADALLLHSLKSEDQARRKRRRLMALAVLGGIPVITAALWIAFSVANASQFPAAAPPAQGAAQGRNALVGTTLAANAPAAPAAPSRPAAAAAPASPAAPAPADAKADALPAYKPGDAVQIKWGGQWFDGKIVQRESDIYLVSYASRAASQNEWVTFDRIRPPGSARDIDYARPTRMGQKPDAAARAAAMDNYQRSIGAAPAEAPGRPARPGRTGARDEQPAQNAGDLSAVRAPELTNTWTYKPDTSSPAATLRPGPFILEAATGAIFEKADALLVAPGGTKVAVSFIDATPGKNAQAKVDLFDLAIGRRTSYTMPPETKPLALSPDGSRIALATNKFGFGENTQVDILTLGSDGKAASVASFAPYGAEEGPARDVAWAAMPDNEHVLTMSGRFKLTLWKIADAKAVWTLEGVLNTDPVVSPGGKFVFIDADQRTVAIEILTGKGAGRLPGALGLQGKRTIRPDGAQLANASNNRIKVVDLNNNTIVSDIFLPPGISADELAWAGDKSLLVANRYLLDIDKGIITWDYQTEGVALTRAVGNRLWYVTAPRAAAGPNRRTIDPTLASAAIPHPAAVNAAKAVDDKAYAVKSGTKVTVEVNNGGIGDQAKITAALTQRLADNGMTVAPGQPVKLVANITPGKTRDISYRMFGSPGVRTVSVTDQQVTLRFMVEDKVAWEAGSLYSAPHMLSLKEGQTTQQAVEEHQASAWKFFETADLPKRMPAPKEPLGYGKSALSASR